MVFREPTDAKEDALQWRECGLWNGNHRGMDSELQRKIHKDYDAPDISPIAPGASYWQVL